MAVDKLGRYEIKKELARGGMATVYIAYDPVAKRNVALKVLPPQFTHDPKFYDRFQIEVATLALLEHAAIVPVYDYGEDHEFPYLVMRLMLGGTLAARIDGAPLPLAEALTITRRVCAALDKAHSKGVIHRDIKPSNILFDEDGYAYLGDFGIVKIAEATRTTQTIGTPEYMAPEQIEDQPLDRRTDVYQMGIVLFEMLTGRQLYTAESPIALLFKHVQAPIPALQEFNPYLPASCQDIINKALAKNPQNRFATAGALASALGRAVSTAGKKTGLETNAPDRQELIRLRTLLVKHFDMEELRLLCFDPGLDYEELPGRTKSTKMQDVISYLERRGELLRLVDEANSRRPNVTWPDFAPTAEDTSISDEGAAKWEDKNRNIFSIKAETDAKQKPAAEPPPEQEQPGSLAEGLPAKSYIDEMTGLEMIHIPADAFLYGEDTRWVDLPEFWISKTPVTNSQYFQFVRARRYDLPKQWNGKPPGAELANHPVTFVSWHDAQAYAGWAGMN